MRKSTITLISVAVTLVVIMFFSGCGRIPPGYEGIIVDQWGSQRGVRDFTVKTGYFLYNPITKSVFKWPIFVQTAVWTRNPKEGSPNNEEITFNTKEGLVVRADISISYRIKGGASPFFYVKFRSADLDAFTHGYLRNEARDAFNEIGCNFNAEDVYGPKKEELLKMVKERVNNAIKAYAIIEQFGFIGSVRLPEPVVAALNAKITATQKAIQRENELREAKAEARKAIEKAKGEASANEILTKSLTPTLIEWQKLDLTKLAIKKWDGVRPLVEGNSGLLLSLQAPQSRKK